VDQEQPTTDQSGGGETTAPTAEENGGTVAPPTWNVVGRTLQNHTYDEEILEPTGEPAQQWRWEHPLTPESDVTNVRYSTPVTSDGTLYTLFSGQFYREVTDSDDYESTYRNRLIALDAETGEQDWETTVAPEDGSMDGPGVEVFAPTVADGSVVLHARTLQALDAETGEQRWENEEAGPLNGPLVTDGDDLFVPSRGDGASLEVYDLADGSERWSALDRVSNGSFVGLTEETVFVAALDEVVALNRSDGSERWRTAAGADSYRVDPEGRTPVHSPVVDDEAVYVAGGVSATNQLDAGALVALDRRDGAELWRFKPDAGDEESTLSAVYGLPMLHDGTLYAIGGRNDLLTDESSASLYAVNATDGTVEWDVTVPSVSLQVVGAGEFVYVVTHEQVSVYSVADGTELASTSFEPGTLNSIYPNVFSGDTLVTGSQDGVVGFGPN
jgi:outer membrane protein assembly factor BamB